MGQSGLRGPGPLELRCGREEELVKVTENDRQRGKVHGHSRDHGAKSKSRGKQSPGRVRRQGGLGTKKVEMAGGGADTSVPLLGKTIKVGG